MKLFPTGGTPFTNRNVFLNGVPPDANRLILFVTGGLSLYRVPHSGIGYPIDESQPVTNILIWGTHS